VIIEGDDKVMLF